MKQPARNYDTYTSMTSNSSAEDTSTREKATFANSLGRRTTLSPKTCVRFCCMETGCTSRFRRPYDLARHKKTIHGPKKLCSYESCTYATARSDKMNEHTRKKHAERGEFLRTSKKKFSNNCSSKGLLRLGNPKPSHQRCSIFGRK